MDVPASFSGGHDSRAFLSMSLSGFEALFFSSEAVRLAVGGGTGGGENVVSDTCQDGLSLGIFCCLLGGRGPGLRRGFGDRMVQRYRMPRRCGDVMCLDLYRISPGYLNGMKSIEENDHGSLCTGVELDCDQLKNRNIMARPR